MARVRELQRIRMLAEQLRKRLTCHCRWTTKSPVLVVERNKARSGIGSCRGVLARTTIWVESTRSLRRLVVSLRGPRAPANTKFPETKPVAASLNGLVRHFVRLVERNCYEKSLSKGQQVNEVASGS
jgi:hypothetical protein